MYVEKIVESQVNRNEKDRCTKPSREKKNPFKHHKRKKWKNDKSPTKV